MRGRSRMPRSRSGTDPASRAQNGPWPRAEPMAWPGHPGHRYFTRLTWIFTGKRPAHARAAQTITLPVH